REKPRVVLREGVADRRARAAPRRRPRGPPQAPRARVRARRGVRDALRHPAGPARPPPRPEMTDLRSVPSWINLRSTQQDELRSQLPPLGSWCLVPPAALPSVFPARLRDKIGAALVI